YMFLSPGLSYSAITERYATSANVERLPVEAQTYFIHGEPVPTYTKLHTFGLGANNAPNFPVLIVPTPAPPAVAGWIGIDLLEHFDLEIDFAAARVNLFVPGSCDRAYWATSYGELTLHHPEGYGQTHMELDGERVGVTFDTLVPYSSMPFNFAKKEFELEPGGVGVAPYPAGGFVHTFGKLTADSFAIDALPVVLEGDPNDPPCDPKGRVKETTYYRITTTCVGMGDLLLGTNQLKQFHLYFAFKSHALYFTAANAH
ncbi:MAG: hypothetical protein JO167_00145, partial [Alphaproteobacteria bacterium]|nr:hypothetical protein [Alphaproteobacteria bacterium]